MISLVARTSGALELDRWLPDTPGASISEGRLEMPGRARTRVFVERLALDTLPGGDQVVVVHVPDLEAARELVRRRTVRWVAGSARAEMLADAGEWSAPTDREGRAQPIPTSSGGRAPDVLEDKEGREVLGYERDASGDLSEVTQEAARDQVDELRGVER